MRRRAENRGEKLTVLDVDGVEASAVEGRAESGIGVGALGGSSARASRVVSFSGQLEGRTRGLTYSTSWKHR